MEEEEKEEEKKREKGKKDEQRSQQQPQQPQQSQPQQQPPPQQQHKQPPRKDYSNIKLGKEEAFKVWKEVFELLARDAAQGVTLEELLWKVEYNEEKGKLFGVNYEMVREIV